MKRKGFDPGKWSKYLLTTKERLEWELAHPKIISYRNLWNEIMLQISYRIENKPLKNFIFQELIIR